ncbi:hypothetical protein EDD15DRAFT_141497 [Pisolithus albus]|nr:hypothetical protein EDD15DRAFT_141497 [Pisolithus albus]
MLVRWWLVRMPRLHMRLVCLHFSYIFGSSLTRFNSDLSCLVIQRRPSRSSMLSTCGVKEPRESETHVILALRYRDAAQHYNLSHRLERSQRDITSKASLASRCMWTTTARNKMDNRYAGVMRCTLNPALVRAPVATC